jgi:GNAT superfamily N-acetyltransferase
VVGSARRATPADATLLVALEADARASVASQRGGPLFLTRDARAFDASRVDDTGVLVVVGHIDDVPVGYAVVACEALADGTALAVLEALYVEEEAREVGVGEAMMGLVVEWCAERGVRGIDAVALPGDRATKNFFERFGLTARAIVVHRPFTRDP